MVIIITRLCIRFSELGVSKLLWPTFLQYPHSQPLASAILLSVSRSLVFKIFCLFLVSGTALLLALPVPIPGPWGYSEDWPGQQGNHCILVARTIRSPTLSAWPSPVPGLLAWLQSSWWGSSYIPDSLVLSKSINSMHCSDLCQRSKGWL